jgi:hypothetical protein
MGVSMNELQKGLMTTPPDQLPGYNPLPVLPKIPEKPCIISKISLTLSPCRIFYLKKGCYGLSRAGTQEGDVIALLFPDHFVPFVLRKLGAQYDLVGTAYLPRPIKDSLIEKVKRDRGILQSFDIV